MCSPRRTLLDKVLVDAARAAGADIRENFTVDELRRTTGR
jgi:flavin-dependent dehydrogenase